MPRHVHRRQVLSTIDRRPSLVDDTQRPALCTAHGRDTARCAGPSASGAETCVNRINYLVWPDRVYNYCSAACATASYRGALLIDISAYRQQSAYRSHSTRRQLTITLNPNSVCIHTLRWDVMGCDGNSVYFHMEAFTHWVTSAAHPIPSQRVCECTITLILINQSFA